jgi:hypothetical protein
LFQLLKKIIINLHINYNLDINIVYYTSSLTMNIFKFNYLNKIISKLPNLLYNIIRQSYKGGIVEVYKCYHKILYFYNINLLYPYVMLNFISVG